MVKKTIKSITYAVIKYKIYLGWALLLVGSAVGVGVASACAEASALRNRSTI